ncbi:MAG: peptidoglycan-binding protein [Xanthobacteraceae bacterium]|nr:peptidoglycan-binding protein [Xanthobacteraceae bacterium]
MRWRGLTVSAVIAAALMLAVGAPAPLAEPAKKAAPPKKAAPAKKAEAKKGPTPGAYANMPMAERAAIQFDLNWTNHYSGPADGEFSDRSVAAVKAFQRDRGFRETGVLTDGEREALANSARNRRARVGWRMVEDRVTGAQVGVPTNLAKHESRVGSGTRWQTAQGQFQIETFRVREPGATLATVFDDQKKEPPNRRVATSTLRNGSFVITGTQGLKNLLIRAEVRDLEIRGIAVLYDPAIEATTDFVALGVLSGFAPFPGTGVMALIGPPARSRIEYGSGIVVTDEGHVMTDRELTEGCSVIQVAGHGDASRIADYDNLTLLRVFSRSALTPAAIVHEGALASALTLVGIADPKAQGGERSVTTTSVRLEGDALDPPPPLGFAGAAALDARGRIFGMVTLKAPVLASAGTAAIPAATVVPVAAIRQFLDSHYVTPATGRSGIDAARASIVRVICVRR